ncbi:MAG: HAD-IC family P-type ATPase [Acidobacteria bacterium]|nr:HAD-IC family P-type ATPase [Acidobacteriota bacterium]
MSPDAITVPVNPADDAVDVCALDGSAVLALQRVEADTGLSTAEVSARTVEFGANRLAEPEQRSRLAMFLDQFRSSIVAILAAAAVIAGLVGHVKDTLVILVVLLVNAVFGYVQEGRASGALAALERMLITIVRVRRDGRVQEVPAEELVPGDIVLLEAGDRVPADGRIILAANASIDEASLTGESVPVDKRADHLADAGAPLGDRLGMVFMNTTVVRGRVEAVITATGMRTEMGRVADLLTSAEATRTPLERQLDTLGRRLAMLAGAAAVAVLALQLVRGTRVGVALLDSIALAVAAIPEGLPAVVTVTLALGVARMAKRNAIVKRLHSVETLGATSVICSDKTGTLTLNQMTAREILRGDAVWHLSGEGYSIDGSVTDADGVVVGTAHTQQPALVMALCSDAVAGIFDESGEPTIVGDPTEGALVVAAEKLGVPVVEARAAHPRLGEVPFDSATKFMATFHRPDPAGDVLVCVKGAPDVLLERASTLIDGTGDARSLDESTRGSVHAANERLAGRGMRVLAVATRLVPAAEILDAEGSVFDPDAWIADLRLEALVGIIDPPRAEARDAIAACHVAGIGVKMITGDHAVTAGAIAGELGITGGVITGAQLDAMDDTELAERVGSIGVFARVSPEHKVRVVTALQANGEIVAMTGDGVNDAAALRHADIGVAMGITGTEVTKEASDMVLVDDDFATIVEAVKGGRAIYDNIIKFVRFQLSTNISAILTIVGASLVSWPVPFTPLQILWVNLIADGPPAITLGTDTPDDRVMQRPPVRPGSAILSGGRILRIGFTGAVMAASLLLLFAFSLRHYGLSASSFVDDYDSYSASARLVLTMMFTTFVFQQLFNVFNARTENESILRRRVPNRALTLVVGGLFLLQIAVVQLGFLQGIFRTVDLSIVQILLCAGIASLVVVTEEIRKAVDRNLAGRR